MKALAHVLKINLVASVSRTSPDTLHEWIVEVGMQNLPRVSKLKVMKLPQEIFQGGLINVVVVPKISSPEYDLWEIPKGENKDNGRVPDEKVH